MVVGGRINDIGVPAFENQAFGFERRLNGFFRALYSKTLKVAMGEDDINTRALREYKQDNGYITFTDSIRELMGSASRDVVMTFQHQEGYVVHPERQVGGSEGKG